ncbi:DUF6361 family protein [Leucobacter sp. HY1910]
MASSITWLDSSSVEQRRIREILGLFTSKESLEELGLGQVRDALADALFPGTSTLHTRARYLLFIPWIFQQVSQERGSLAQAQAKEIELIGALKSYDARARGIIGAEAGAALKTMPSTIYWSALGSYGILTDPKLNRGQAISAEGTRLQQDDPEHRSLTLRAWRPEMPPVPEGFPAQAIGGMQLTADEAAWLRERFIASAPGSMLAHLVSHLERQQLTKDSGAPWEDLATSTAAGDAQHALHHARLFSETMHGAQLLYNLLIAESYEAHGLTRQAGAREKFAARLSDWAEQYENVTREQPWSLNSFFTLITRTRGRSPVGTSTERFVREWVQTLATANAHEIASHAAARELVRTRERRNKGPMARIDNRPRLETWGGSSGAGRYVYRWSYVRTILTDIADGLAHV